MTKLILGVLASVTLAVSAAPAHAGPAPRQVPWRVHVMSVPDNGVVRWKSEHRYSPTVAIRVAVYVDGGEVALGSNGGCRASFVDGRVAVSESACEKGAASLRVKAVSLDGSPHRISVAYKPISNQL